MAAVSRVIQREQMSEDEDEWRAQVCNTLKGQSHEKVYEFLTWDGSFRLN
jgi:hypothetical protein